MAIMSSYMNAYFVKASTLPPLLKSEFRLWFPFLFIHMGCFLAFLAGISLFSIGAAIVLYWVRMFAITAFYHRYFSHRTFTTNRFWQFLFAVWGMTAIQKGPLWWAMHHRHHHRNADLPEDIHSPVQSGFLWSHIGWLTTQRNLSTDYDRIRDFSRFPELVWLNHFDAVVPILYALVLYGTGSALKAHYPQWHTNGFQLLVWGGFISTTALYHGTFTINSLAHQFGTRRYETSDTSRNNGWLALITLGEGWHNNHHFYPGSTRQGFFWWEIDVCYYILCGFEKLGIVHKLHPVPAWVYATSLKEKTFAASRSIGLDTP